MAVVHQRPLQRQYVAGCCSFSNLVSILCIVGTIVLPFYLAYTSHNFWLKTSTYYDQPTLLFKHKVLVLLHGQSPSQDPVGTTLVWSSEPDARDVYERYLRAGVMRAWPEHTNQDAVPDRWRIEVKIPLEGDEKIYSMELLAYFDYTLNGAAFLDMEAVAFAQHHGAIPGDSIYLDGDAALVQRVPLSSRDTVYDASSTASGASSVTASSHVLQEIVSTYANRNISMAFEERYRVWGSVPLVNPTVSSSLGSSNSFCVNMTIRVPQQEVLYLTHTSEMLKWAWVQYLAFFLIIAVAFDALKNVLFANQVLETTVLVEAKQAPVTVAKHTF